MVKSPPSPSRKPLAVSLTEDTTTKIATTNKMTKFKLNKTGHDFIETQNRKIKLAIPAFIFIGIAVTIGIYLKLGLDTTSIVVMTFLLALNYYFNIHIARNKRQEILNCVATTIDVDNKQLSVSLVDNNSISNIADMNAISKSKHNITLSEYLKLADIWTIKNGDKNVYIIPDFFDNFKATTE